MLDRQSLSSAHSLQNVKEELVRVSGDSKQLMLMSSSNLVDTVLGDMELISAAREFTVTERLQLPTGTRVLVDGSSWTLSAWVRLDRGNILKQVVGDTEKMCWGWEVDYTMQLRFGGHDAELETVVKGMQHNHRRSRPTQGGGSSNTGGGSNSGDSVGGGGVGGGLSGLQHVAVVVTTNK